MRRIHALLTLSLAVGCALRTGLAHADSTVGSLTADSGRGVSARAHLAFRITIEPNIRLPAAAAIAQRAGEASPGGRTAISQLRYSRRSAISQVLVFEAADVAGGVPRYTAAEP